VKRILIFVFLCLLITKSVAQNHLLSDSVRISLITCSPGEEIYARYGHSAMRVCDPSKGVDLVFNFGVFNFNTDNFVFKFIKGETDYVLAVYDFNTFLPEYRERNSTVWEQVLNLSVAEKKELVRLLFENNQPENRVYRYNFIYDNCATRPRDKVLESLDGKVIYKTAPLYKTFREWVGEYIGYDTWMKFGIDIVFGAESDKQASRNASMFLPVELMEQMQDAVVMEDNGLQKKLVKNDRILVESVSVGKPEHNLQIKPITVALSLFVLSLVLTLAGIRKRRHFRWFDSLLFFVSGAAGCIVFYLMFFSLHPMVRENLNLLWLSPLNLIAAVVVWIKPIRDQFSYYMLLFGLSLLTVFVLFPLQVQGFNIAFLPLIGTLLIRTGTWLYLNQKHCPVFVKIKKYKRSTKQNFY